MIGVFKANRELNGEKQLDFKEFAGVAPGIIERELDLAPLKMQASLQL